MLVDRPITGIAGTTALLVCALALSVAVPAAPPAPDHPLLSESRAITARFASQLQAALQTAMRDGGPAAAIAVCRDVAPRIASALSRASGAKVQRTSLRFRNPANAPEPWQRSVLRGFNRAAAGGTEPGALEHTESGDDGSLRYLKAIPTGGLCLNCHGSDVSPAVEAALAEHYPHDLARGYALGEIRGAFSVTWPAEPPPR